MNMVESWKPSLCVITQIRTAARLLLHVFNFCKTACLCNINERYIFNHPYNKTQSKNSIPNFEI